jgi:hypothetical protein
MNLIRAIALVGAFGTSRPRNEVSPRSRSGRIHGST